MSHSVSSSDDEDPSHNDLPFKFRIQDDDLDQGSPSDADSYDDGFNWDTDEKSDHLGESPRKESEMTSSLFVDANDNDENNDLFTSIPEQSQDLLDLHDESLFDCFEQATHELPSANNVSTEEQTTSSVTASANAKKQQHSFIAHKGALKRLVNSHQNDASKMKKQDPSVWPVYSVTVNATDLSVVNTEYSSLQSTPTSEQYQILYSRSQYEKCIKMFTVLDTECTSSLGPECVKEFVRKYCPVVRRRDDALVALNSTVKSDANDSNAQKYQTELYSPTFDEVWNVVIQSDLSYQHEQEHFNPRLGIEGWMVFTRLLSLVSHLESQRQFSSRHLQQMMRHKYNGGDSGISPRVNPNEVVVVIDNPPAGPPLPVSIRGLMEIEAELPKEDKSKLLVKGWHYASLPMIELDLNHTVVKIGDSQKRRRNGRRRVTIEPFSATAKGDFILSYCEISQGIQCSGKSTVVRRSYADFCWLNETLIMQKRPGHGNLCGRILPPFPPKQSSSSRIAAVKYHDPRSKDVSERAVAAAKSGVGMITSVAKSLWGNYIAASPSSSPNEKPKDVRAQYSWSGYQEKDSSTRVARRMDRYFNYLLENEVLSISFPLNAVLTVSIPDAPYDIFKKTDKFFDSHIINLFLFVFKKASQSGLECSKQILNDQMKQRKRIKANQSLVSNNSNTRLSAYAILSTLLANKPSSYFHLSGSDDTPWLRIAARTAMSLQFHGILETTGHESTSAKIQHASLPRFGVSAGNWDEDESINDQNGATLSNHHQESLEGDFESGVVCIESELVGEDGIEGYDLLPSPGPSEEHHVLNATNNSPFISVENSPLPPRVRFVYDTSSDTGNSAQMPSGILTSDAATLGPVKVDGDIDKLKNIIKSMDLILRRLHKSSISIELAQAARNELQLNLLKDIDSFGQSHVSVISQRSLVNGAAALDRSNTALRLSNESMSDGKNTKHKLSDTLRLIIIYSDLISSVCCQMYLDFGWQSALASSAVGATKEVKDAVTASQTASRAKAAAFTAAAKSKKAYESLDSSNTREEINHAQSEASSTQSHAIHATVVEYEANMAKKRAAISLAQDVKCWNSYRKRELHQTCLQYVKTQREACRKSADAWESLREGLIDLQTPSFASEDLQALSEHLETAQTRDSLLSSRCVDSNFSEEFNMPYSSNFGDARSSLNSHKPVNASEVTSSTTLLPDAIVDAEQLTGGSADDEYVLRPSDMPNLDDNHFALQQDIISAAESSSFSEGEAMDSCAFQADDFGIESVLSQKEQDVYNCSASGENMTMSMQSLIDGLMAWGGDEEHIDDNLIQTEDVGKTLKNSTLVE